jgi:hypothetical protein
VTRGHVRLSVYVAAGKPFIDYGISVCSTQKFWREKGGLVHNIKSMGVAFNINETRLLFLAVRHTHLTHPHKNRRVGYSFE